MNFQCMWALLAALLASSSLVAEEVSFSSDRWQIQAQESALETHLGRESLMLKGGMAWLPDADFQDGTVRFDMAFGQDRGFSGLAFRIQDAGNYEHFYVRPHRSGHPDANQYTPVFNGNTGWQLYFGERYSAQMEYEFNTWIPVRMVIRGTEAEIYIGDMDIPALFLPELKHEPKAGPLGVNSANFAPAWFSSFSYDPTPVELTGSRQAPGESLPEDLVTTWQISETFDYAKLKETTELDSEWTDTLAWSPLETEPPGFANIGRLRSLGEGQNTVFARLQIESAETGNTLLEFGYSDIARVYLNGRLLYTGNNTYMSRDFRYLGTIGLFDAVNLQLRPGNNEVWIAVTEQFGGWGVMARVR